MKIKFLFISLMCSTLLMVACKKKSEGPSVKDLLTSHVWIGVNLNYNVSSLLFNDAQVVNTDSSAVEFTKDNVAIFYRRDVNTGTLTERTRQNYTISSDSKKIEIASTEGLLTPEIQASLSTVGITIPTSINIDKVTDNELILKGSLQQTLSGGLPITIAANYTWTYRK